MLAYSAGLRVGEVVKLKPEDIDSKTTEIYTHVSTKSLGKIASPIDTLHLDEGDEA